MQQQTELVAAIKTPLVLTGNFDEVRAHFVEQLKKYDLVVTAETLAEAKKLATDLNKAATEVKSRGKAVSSEASAPINEFNEQVKELAQLLLDARLKLTEQVKTFEDETRQAAADALFAYLIEQAEVKGVQVEFQLANIDGLVNLSTLTAAGNLTAKAKAAVDERISADLHLQNQTEMRLLKLENESYKAGLSAPLSRNHVDAFLFEDDNVYQMRLASLLETELNREQRAQEAMRVKLEQEQKRNAEAEQRARDAEAARIESDRQRAEDKANHDKQMAEFKAEQEKAASEQPVAVRHAELEPSQHLGGEEFEQPIKYAVGDRYAPKLADIYVCTKAEAAVHALYHQSEKTAIWTEEGGKAPVALVIKGSLVKEYL